MVNRRLFLAIGFGWAFLLLSQASRTLQETNWSLRTSLRFLPRNGVWRSVYFMAGPYTADFTLFLRAYTPPDANIALPPREADVPFFYQQAALVSWAILPRRVLVNCPDQGCVVRLVASGRAYAPWFRPEPPSGLSRAHWLAYNHERGLLVPSNVVPAFSPEPEGWWVLLGHLLLGWGGILAWWLAGGTLLRLFAVPDELPREARSALAWLLGTGVMGFGFLGGLALGLPARWLAWSLLLMALALAWPTVRWLMGTVARFLQYSAWKTWDFWLGFAIGGYLIILAFLGWAKGYHADDAMGIWASKGYALVDVGIEQMRQIGLYRDYPLFLPALIGFFRALAGDTMVESKWIFGVFSLNLGLWVYGRLRRRIGPQRAALATWMLVTTPWYAQHSMIGYANLPFALPLVVAASWPISGSAYLPGLLLALAVWIRPEGLYVSLAVALGRLTVALNKNRARSHVVAWLLPYGLSALLWWWAHNRLYPNRHLSGEMMALVLKHGQDMRLFPHLAQVLSFAAQGLWGGAWGYLGPAMMLLLVVLLLWGTWRQIEVFAVFGIGLAVFLIYALFYAFLGFDSTWGLQWWLETGFYRMAAPGVLIAWVGAWLGVDAPGRFRVS